jgi:hypothetical protein
LLVQIYKFVRVLNTRLMPQRDDLRPHLDIQVKLGKFTPCCLIFKRRLAVVDSEHVLQRHGIRHLA